MPELNRAQLLEKWSSVLDNENVESIQSHEVKNVVAQVLENTNEKGNLPNKKTEVKYSLTEASGTVADHIDYQDPIFVAMVRRTMPSLIAFDVVGVQAMKGPTGLLFATRAWYGAKADGNEALGLDEPNKDFTGSHATAAAEVFGTDLQQGGTGAANDPVTQVAPWAELEFSIESTSVTARTRKLKGRLTNEVMQDLRNTHGMDAEMELSNMMVGEIKAEMNREMVSVINTQAKPGAQTGVTAAGTYDFNADSDGRWSVEKYKEFMIFLHRESQVVARETRRGLANFIITTADIAAGLAEASKIDTTFQTQGLSFDGIGVTYAGLLSGRFKLYIDSYATSNYITLGYKGASAADAGIIWAPYIGLEKHTAIGEEDFNPRIGYSTRYGIAYNPFVSGNAGENQYYRTFAVANM